jgi:hypothetical protein
MAKVYEEVIVIKLSKLTKDSESDHPSIANVEIEQTLEQVVQELVGDAVIVEVERA